MDAFMNALAHLNEVMKAHHVTEDAYGFVVSENCDGTDDEHCSCLRDAMDDLIKVYETR